MPRVTEFFPLRNAPIERKMTIVLDLPRSNAGRDADKAAQALTAT